MPKIRDLGINAIPVGKHPALWRLDSCPGQSPGPCPGQSPVPCPGQSPVPCPGQSPRNMGGERKFNGLSADAIAQLRQHLDHAVTSRFAQ